MDGSPVWGEGRRLPLVPSATEAKAYDIHRNVIVSARLLHTVWPTAGFVDFTPSYTPDRGRVSFEALFDTDGRQLLDERGLSDLCSLAAQREPGRAGDDRAVAVEALFGLRRAVSDWRGAKILRIPAGATWELRVGTVRDGSGAWMPAVVQLVLPAQDDPRQPDALAIPAASTADIVGRPI